jgi:hypothetical protein
MDGHYCNVPCRAECDSRDAPVPTEKPKADNSRPPLIQINTDISGRTELLLY